MILKYLAPSLAQFSKTKQSKILSTFKKDVIQKLRNDFEIIDEQITVNNGNKFVAVEINYPTFFSCAEALRPHILLGLTVAELLLSPVNLPVSSMINQVAKRQVEISNIGCINPVENAADKLSAITWRIAERVMG
ncbi:hypothetical protein [Arcicella lustrica]|uniref:Uncharacterized protein n=1 Tax=Arcicella lustrica TaxID=2984196 RepID=A0ABU5SKN4_9BACT|nr:hypothetical protein [Arcicella sp. DC25W]MEA5427861.1 hypothetical protein [Arcicella sp. DC25W]